MLHRVYLAVVIVLYYLVQYFSVIENLVNEWFEKEIRLPER